MEPLQQTSEVANVPSLTMTKPTISATSKQSSTREASNSKLQPPHTVDMESGNDHGSSTAASSIKSDSFHSDEDLPEEQDADISLPMEILFRISLFLNQAKAAGKVESPFVVSCSGSIDTLMNSFTAFERILHTPIPKAYDIHLWVLLRFVANVTLSATDFPSPLQETRCCSLCRNLAFYSCSSNGLPHDSCCCPCSLYAIWHHCHWISNWEPVWIRQQRPAVITLLWSAKERGGMGYLSYPNLHRVSLIERCLIHSVNCRIYDNKDLEKVIKKISYILNRRISFSVFTVDWFLFRCYFRTPNAF